jgi:hypothetical protein
MKKRGKRIYTFSTRSTHLAVLNIEDSISKIVNRVVELGLRQYIVDNLFLRVIVCRPQFCNVLERCAGRELNDKNKYDN